MGGRGAGEVRWNKETQSWVPVGADGHPAPPPPPVRPPGTDGSGGEGPGEWHTPAPPGWPQPPSVPPAAPGGRRPAVVVGAAVAAVAVTALAAWLAVGGTGDDGDDKAGGTASSTAATSEGAPTAPSDATSDWAEPTDGTFSAASESPDVPDGHRLVDDPSGFTTVVPEDWTRSERDGGAVVFYTSPDERRLLQIFEVVEPGLTPDGALGEAFKTLSEQPGFTEISRGPVPGETDASELVYEYDSKDLGERVRAVDRVFRTDDGGLYAMVVRGTTDDWPTTQETLQNARSAFTPS